MTELLSRYANLVIEHGENTEFIHVQGDVILQRALQLSAQQLFLDAEDKKAIGLILKLFANMPAWYA